MEAEAKEQTEIVRAKNAKDLQIQSLTKKKDELKTEVESLNAVLEMKSGEIRNLRQENQKLEAKLDEFDKINLELKKANAAVEDLKEQIQTKNCLERRLSAENRKLSVTVEKEMGENKRLSMENEELVWKIKQSTENLSVSMLEGKTKTSPLP